MKLCRKLEKPGLALWHPIKTLSVPFNYLTRREC